MTRNLELEAAIAASPDDDQGYLVYGDWLQQQGNPRGELVVGHVRAQSRPAFIADHETDLLGPLADYQDMLEPREWRAGFLMKVKVANTFERSPLHDGAEDAFPVEELLGLLLDNEAGWLLNDLTIGIADYEANDYTACMRALGARRVPSLRHLFIGDFKRNETELNWSHLGDAAPLYAGVPNLQTLTLRSGSMTLGAIDLPELRTFTTITGGLMKDAIASIAAARWPKLERLELQLGSARYGSDIKPNDLRPIFDDCLPPGVDHLALANYEYTNDIVEMLATSKVLPRLRSLDLSLGTLTRPGAEGLIAARSAFAHLAQLNLDENWLDPEMAARVRETCPNANLGKQRYNPRYPDDHDAYIAAGE